MGWTLAVAAAPSALVAQTGERVLAPFNACRAIADVRARAPCYDAAYDRLRGALADRRVVIVDRLQAETDRNGLLGLSRGEPRLSPGPIEPAPGTVIASRIAAARPSGSDLWTVLLVSGVTWRTIEPLPALDPRPGQPVRIRRGFRSEFTMKVGTARAVRAVRAN